MWANLIIPSITIWAVNSRALPGLVQRHWWNPWPLVSWDLLFVLPLLGLFAFEILFGGWCIFCNLIYMIREELFYLPYEESTKELENPTWSWVRPNFKITIKVETLCKNIRPGLEEVNVLFPLPQSVEMSHSNGPPQKLRLVLVWLIFWYPKRVLG